MLVLAKAPGHDPPQRTRPSVPHWLQPGPKPLRARRQRAWASVLWPLGFGAWPWRLRPLPSLLLSSFSPDASGCPGVQVSRCPGVQVSRRSGTPRTRLEPGGPDLAPPAQAHWLRPACSPSGSALVRLPQAIAPSGCARRAWAHPRPALRPPGGLYGGALKAHPSSSAQALQGPIPSANTAGPIGAL